MSCLSNPFGRTCYPTSQHFPFQNPTLGELQGWLRDICKAHQVTLSPTNHFMIWTGKPVKTLPSSTKCPCISQELTQARPYVLQKDDTTQEFTGKLVPVDCTRHPKRFSLNVDLARARQLLEKMGQLPESAKGNPAPLTVADVLRMNPLQDTSTRVEANTKSSYELGRENFINKTSKANTDPQAEKQSKNVRFAKNRVEIRFDKVEALANSTVSCEITAA